MIVWFADLRARIADREVAPGWTVVLVPLPIVAVVAVGSYSGGVLPWLNARFSLGWFSVLAVAVAGFAGGYAATSPPAVVPGRDGVRPRLIARLGGTRLVALAIFCCCSYFLKVLSGFIPDREVSRLAGYATWWGIPAMVCVWALASVEFSFETELAGSGVPADPSRQWEWFLRLRRSRRFRRLAYGFLFGGTVATIVVAMWPGLAWGVVVSTSIPAWRGDGYTPVIPFFAAFSVWAAIVLVTSFLYLAHSFRARPAGLPRQVLRRAWYSLWAAGALAVAVLLVVAAGLGWLSEPLVDAAIAPYLLAFVLMMVEATTVTKRPRIRPSLGRRTAGAVSAIGFGFSIALITGLPLFRAGLLAAAISGSIPLAQPMFRVLFGIEREPLVPDMSNRLLPTAEEWHALEPLLVGEPFTVALPKGEVLRRWHKTLQALAAAAVPKVASMPRAHPLIYILFTADDGLSPPKNWRKWMTPEIAGYLERLFPGEEDEQTNTLINLMRQTANELLKTGEPPHRFPTPPTPMEALEAECAARLPQKRPWFPADPAGQQRWHLLLKIRRGWVYGGLDTWQYDVAKMTPGKIQYDKNRNEARRARLVRACTSVTELWLERLEAAQPGTTIAPL